MWRRDQITFMLELDACAGVVDTIRVLTPAGPLLVMGVCGDVTDAVLRVTGVHMNGAPGSPGGPGEIGAANLKVIAQAFMEAFGYAGLIVEGAYRTTGRRRGKRPRPMRFARHRED